MNHVLMHQTAPYPHELATLVDQLEYRLLQGWKVWLEDLERDPPATHRGASRGLTLVVLRVGPDTYNPDRTLKVRHYFPVPPATYDRGSWQRWLFDQLGLVDLHERMEDFKIAGSRPYAPNHGPGESPYLVHELATDEQRRTSFRGEVQEGSP